MLEKSPMLQNLLKYLWLVLSFLLAPILSGLPEKIAPQLAKALTQSQWLRVTTASFVLLMASVAYIAYLLYTTHKKTTPKLKYQFVEELGIKWRYNNLSTRIESTPYCPKHQLKMVIFNGIYCCPDCDVKANDDVYLKKAYQIAQNKAEAIIGKHYKENA